MYSSVNNISDSDIIIMQYVLLLQYNVDHFVMYIQLSFATAKEKDVLC